MRKKTTALYSMSDTNTGTADISMLEEALDYVATLDSNSEAALARRQIEALLTVALHAAGGNYAYVLSPAGNGDYSEQFVKLAGLVQRNNDGLLQARHDALINRRPDAKILSVMRLRRGVRGKSSDIGLPLCLPGSHPPIAYFLMVPLVTARGQVSVMLVANPTVRPGAKVYENLLHRLAAMCSALVERQLAEMNGHHNGSGGARLATNHQATQKSAKRKISGLEQRLKRATEQREFTLVYQPQFRIEDESIVSFEALLRWAPDDMQAPGVQQLVNMLEKSGLINEVGHWVLETACRQFREWQDIGLLAEECTVSVNVSPAQLSQAGFASQVSDILGRFAVPPEKLNLEITESVRISANDFCIQVINDIKALGVQLSLDDFGTGYASLSYLTRLPIDTLKLDKSFVMAMNKDEPSRAIVMSVLAMAGTLNIDVVAEGIENTATLEQLRRARCKFGQGYLISKPKTAAQLEPFLVRKQLSDRVVLSLA